MTEYEDTAYGDTAYEEPAYAQSGDELGDEELGLADPVGAGADRPGAPVATGHPAVDAALQAVVAAEQAPPADQIATYQAAHRTLRETLDSIDEQ